MTTGTATPVSVVDAGVGAASAGRIGIGALAAGCAEDGSAEGVELALDGVSTGGASICAAAGDGTASEIKNPMHRAELARDMIIRDGPFHFFVRRRERCVGKPYHADSQQHQQKQSSSGEETVHQLIGP
jgi:hypothetical protein